MSLEIIRLMSSSQRVPDAVKWDALHHFADRGFQIQSSGSTGVNRCYYWIFILNGYCIMIKLCGEQIFSLQNRLEISFERLPVFYLASILSNFGIGILALIGK